MAISSRQVGLLVSEIEAPLCGGLIRNIDQPNTNTLLFEIVQGKQRHRLLFSAHRRFARAHLMQEKFPRPKIPPGFCQLLRAHLRHKRIEMIQQLKGDRIIEMRCRWPGNPAKTIFFVAELTGSTANFFLLDTEERILGMLHQAPSSRALLKGAPYQSPPMRDSPHFKETQMPAASTGPFPLSRTLETYFSELEKQAEEAQQKKETLARFDRAIRRIQRRLRRFQASLEASEQSLQYRGYGEYLKCHLHEISPGATSFYYADPALPDQKSFAVALDPALSAAQNMARFFKRYKKAVAERSMHLQGTKETQHKLDQLVSGKATVERGETLPHHDFPLLPFQSKSQAKTNKNGPTTYLSSDNLRLMVGRNRAQNDALTFHIARGNDLWFHARGAPGSHLVVKMEKLQNLPSDTLLEAATLALYFSFYRKEGKGEVMYTYKKYLQRPKKGKPGEVICTQEKTLFIEIDSERLSKILGNKLEK